MLKKLLLGLFTLFIGFSLIGCDGLDIILDHTAPAKVTNVVTQSFDGKVIVSFTPPADEDYEYTIIYFTFNNQEQSTECQIGETSKEFPSLTNGLDITFRLVAVDVWGNQSDPVTVTATPADIIAEISEIIVSDYVDGRVRLPGEQMSFRITAEPDGACTVNVGSDISIPLTAKSPSSSTYVGAFYIPEDVTYKYHSVDVEFTDKYDNYIQVKHYEGTNIKDSIIMSAAEPFFIWKNVYYNNSKYTLSNIKHDRKYDSSFTSHIHLSHAGTGEINRYPYGWSWENAKKSTSLPNDVSFCDISKIYEHQDNPINDISSVIVKYDYTSESYEESSISIMNINVDLVEHFEVPIINPDGSYITKKFYRLSIPIKGSMFHTFASETEFTHDDIVMISGLDYTYYHGITKRYLYSVMGGIDKGFDHFVFNPVETVSEKGQIDLYPFINYIIQRENLNISNLTYVGMGNEIIKGEGVTIIKDFEITIQ